jgi:hypothetical protein
MERVLESLNFVGVTDYLDHLVLARLEDAMTLDDLEDAFLLLGEGGILGVNLRSVLNGKLLRDVLEHIDGVEVDLLLVHINDGSNGLGHQGEEDGHRGTFQFDVDWDSDSVKDHGA